MKNQSTPRPSIPVTGEVMWEKECGEEGEASGDCFYSFNKGRFFAG
jgi:hypothetical protein